MAEDKRRSAEIRRMASQKVAAELIKASTYATTPDPGTFESTFIQLVDWIDADVVAAGDRAENPSEAPSTPPPSSTPQNGSDAARAPGETLGKQARETVKALLLKVEQTRREDKLVSLHLPVDTDAVVNMITKDEAKGLLPWLRENAKD